MDPDERDVEIFERIPWESLEKPHDRRWVVYLVAAGLVMTAVGVTVGRGMAPAVAPDPTLAAVASTLPAPETVPATPPGSVPVAAAPEVPTAWSEADLMAVPAQALEESAASLAEWFIVDYFTRDGGESDGSGRSFVEWVSVIDRRWSTASEMELTVAVRRLAAVDESEPYRRIPTEAWLVGAELTDDGWTVVSGPVEAEPPVLSVTREPLKGELPAELEGTVDEAVSGAAETDEGWLVEYEWADAAGVNWVVQRRLRRPHP